MLKNITIPRPALFLCLLCLLLLPGRVAAASIDVDEAEVPRAASHMAASIDRQLAERLLQQSPAKGISLAVTVPVDLNDLDISNPLARQMAEELSRWFTQAGYAVQEIRKGRAVLMEPATGEKLLTRRTGQLARQSADAAAILTGTYTVTSKNVRFNVRMLQISTREVLGMATISVPITPEVRSLLAKGKGKGKTQATARQYSLAGPSVGTTLP